MLAGERAERGRRFRVPPVTEMRRERNGPNCLLQRPPRPLLNAGICASFTSPRDEPHSLGQGLASGSPRLPRRVPGKICTVSASCPHAAGTSCPADVQQKPGWGERLGEWVLTGMLADGAGAYFSSKARLGPGSCCSTGLCPPFPLPSLIPSYKHLSIFHIRGSVLGTRETCKTMRDPCEWAET